MNVVIDSEGSRISEPDDLRSFAVQIVGLRDGDADLDLGPVGEFSPDHAHIFVNVVWIRAQVGSRSDDAEWSSKFDGMVRFAAEHGWVDDFGRLRGHVVRG